LALRLTSWCLSGDDEKFHARGVMRYATTLAIAVTIVVLVIIGVQLSGYGNCCDLR